MSTNRVINKHTWKEAIREELFFRMGKNTLKGWLCYRRNVSVYHENFSCTKHYFTWSGQAHSSLISDAYLTFSTKTAGLF